MSRRRNSEIMFGSDSFLDVVANIVGILIILIVIAGVRVSQAPVKSRSAALPSLPDENTVPAQQPVPAIPESLPESEPESEPKVMIPIAKAAEPDPEPLSLNEPPPLPEVVPPRELVQRVQELEAEIAELTLNCNALNEELTRNNRRQTEIEQRIKTAKSLFNERDRELKSVQTRGAALKHDLALAKQTIARLMTQIKEEELKASHVEKLEHRITPVSRSVTGKELHFRLDKNRVAEVPIEALILRLKEHIDRRKDWLVKTKQHKGIVGPIGGFNMEYILGVDQISGLEELRMGHGGYRMSMRWWEIQPENNLRGETDEEALSQGSRFYQCLLGADPDTTLTFWVYPDSFPIYRKLQRFAHEHGFPVAARPLPNGVPIAGSPNGMRSASQ